MDEFLDRALNRAAMATAAPTGVCCAPPDDAGTAAAGMKGIVRLEEKQAGDERSWIWWPRM